MRICVVGANGQVGSELIALQSDTVHKIIPLSRQDCDIVDKPGLQEVIARLSPDIIVNCAAYTAVDRAESEPETAFQVNALAARNLAEIAHDLHIPLVHLSTDYVFNSDSETPYTEESTVDPRSVYGKSKLAGEQMIRAALTEHIIVRVSWVFGRNGHNFVKTMCRLMKERENVSVVSDQFGGPTSANGIANMLLTVCNQVMDADREVNWGTYHFCGKPYVSWFEFAIYISEILKRKHNLTITVSPISTSEYPLPAQRPANSRLDTSRIQTQFNIEADDWKQEVMKLIDELSI